MVRDVLVLVCQLLGAALPRLRLVRQVAQLDRLAEHPLDAGQQRQGCLGARRRRHVVGHAQAAQVGLVREHPGDADGALVVGAVEAEALAGAGVLRRDVGRQGPRVWGVDEQRAARDDGAHAQVLADVEHLLCELAPPLRRLDAAGEHDVAVLEPRARRRGHDGARPRHDALAAYAPRDRGAVHLKVVILLGVQRAVLLGLPHAGKVVDRGRRRGARVVPALEGGDHHALFGSQRFSGSPGIHRASLDWPA